MNYLGNAFSLQMLEMVSGAMLRVYEVAPEKIPTDAVSCIGHADTAAVVSAILGREVPMNRNSITLGRENVLYVAQVIGGRLPEGATTVPEGVCIKFYKVFQIDCCAVSLENSPLFHPEESWVEPPKGGWR